MPQRIYKSGTGARGVPHTAAHNAAVSRALQNRTPEAKAATAAKTSAILRRRYNGRYDETRRRAIAAGHKNACILLGAERATRPKPAQCEQCGRRGSIDFDHDHSCTCKNGTASP